MKEKSRTMIYYESLKIQFQALYNDIQLLFINLP